jgi:predicted transcriptional regulator
MPSQSAITTSVGIRLDNDLLARLDAIVAKQPGATRTSLARDLLRRGLEAAEAQRQGRSASRTRQQGRGRKPKAPEPESAPATELEAFAREVLEAARQTPMGYRFGQDRLFISRAWRAWKEQSGSELDLEAFKTRLRKANRERHLSLVCDDMAPMHRDSGDVEESEMELAPGARAHFLCL